MGRSIVAVTSKEETISPIERRSTALTRRQISAQHSGERPWIESSKQNLFFLTWVFCLLPSTQLPAVIAEHESSKTRDAFADRCRLLRQRCHVELGEASGFLHGVSHGFAGITIFVR